MNKLILLFKVIQIIGAMWCVFVDWRIGIIVFGIILLEFITSHLINKQYDGKINNELKEKVSEDKIDEYFETVSDEQLKKDVNASGYSFFKNIKEKSFSKENALCNPGTKEVRKLKERNNPIVNNFHIKYRNGDN